MIRLELTQIKNTFKVGDPCPAFEPNVVEDTLFLENGVPIGFYLSSLPEPLVSYVELANAEFRSKRVPKSTMTRSTGGVEQYSTIIGGIPPKPHLRRNYPSISSVHRTRSAANFIKAMLLTCRESEALIQKILPEQYETQKRLIQEYTPEQYRFGSLFTSSISNYNIPANFHIDRANIKGAVNVIINKRLSASGGHLHVPDYGATIASKDNSILVYPAWKSMHGVTPIVPESKSGYRNSLVFYPLAGFRRFKGDQ
jgi:hypothetical protein